ncbi:hypothetical protein FFLO_06260 [Filobasidium floriforme]|uniref:Pseudouridine synthase n=1 Tax=Filobasidium floriforme TaxID=5210 RepID=A0A8K0NMC4_9TREE|nr:hypothetical protein FFLO_06260 [Filobasidium floriforme]
MSESVPTETAPVRLPPSLTRNPQLRYCEPYYYPYRTNVKARWIGRQILEVISTEFRDRSVEYYKHALESGVTTVNGKPAKPDLVLKNGDRIENTVHRHEPPITKSPVLVLHKDEARQFIVISKPGSVPVHATGRYFKHTVLELLKSDHGITAYSVNRLDRLTSGLMILATTGKASTGLAQEFIKGHVKKEYLARVRGKFPEEEQTVDQSLLTVDRQMGLVICTPDGKDAKTIFKRMFYDAERDQSVVHCRSDEAGDAHQIRVHLQYLGYPIVNDPLYGDPRVWGPTIGKGGVDLTPDADEDHHTSAGPDDEASTLSSQLARMRGEDPIYLSREAREVISKLRRQKDEAEDWAKWSEVMYRTKQATQETSEGESLVESRLFLNLSGKNRTMFVELATTYDGGSSSTSCQTPSPVLQFASVPPGFCPQCHIPLAPDPAVEALFIYLHAWRYTTEVWGEFSTPL